MTRPAHAPSRPAPVRPPADPGSVIRSRPYLLLLVLAGLLGAPVSVIAYFFLLLAGRLQHWTFTSLPAALGFAAEPVWWPVPLLAVAGIVTALVIRYLPGGGGHSPADGFKLRGAPALVHLPGIVLAALATLSLGVVLGPEAPLIAIGSGLAVCALRLARRDTPAQVQAMVASAGSFAAISTLLGSPLLGAFMLMEAAGLGGQSLELVLLPGLLAAGVGSLIFVGLNAWTGLGTFSLSIPHLPHVGPPTLGEFGWAVAIGVAAALLGTAIRRLGVLVRSAARPWLLAATPAAGLVVAGLAIGYGQLTGRSSSQVLFSGQSALPGLAAHAAAYAVGTLLLLAAAKSLAYAVSLGCFRGGPVFPSMFIGAAGGIAVSHLPGLTMVAGMAMGIAAMCTVMLRLPITSVLLATLLLFSAGVAVMPLVIVAAVVAYVLSARFIDDAPAAGEAPARRPAGGG
jgi:H+/Cl- antiporter ClcA